MTQALNLANFANNLNTSGATSNAGLQNSSVTVTAGTGLSGGGAVSLGGSISLANTGVTSVTGAGTVSVSASSGAVTITGSGGSGTVTSITAGSGLTGGTITTSGTISIDAYNGTTVNYASYAVGTSIFLGANNLNTAYVNTSRTIYSPNTACCLSNEKFFSNSSLGPGSQALAGTWRARGSFTVPPCNITGSLHTRTA